jgi:hypothetical protein
MHRRRQFGVAVLGLAALVWLLGGAERAAAGPMSPLVLDFTGGQPIAAGSPVAVGWEFHVASPITVGGLATWDEGGGPLPNAFPVGLWTAGGSLLATTTVANGNSTPLPSLSGEGVWLATPITPRTLPPGDYVVGEFVPQASDVGRLFATSTTLPGITFEGGLFTPSSALVFPTSTIDGANDGIFGPNLEIAVPEPSTFALLAFGGGALAGWRRWRKRKAA